MKQMLEQGLDPGVLGLGAAATDARIEADKQALERKKAGLAADAPTTQPLLRSLRRAAGAVRYRHLVRWRSAEAAKAALAKELEMKRRAKEGGDDAPAEGQEEPQEAPPPVLPGSTPWDGPTEGLAAVDRCAHGDWEACDEEAVDLAAYLSLGATWTNLDASPGARTAHGTEALAYALTLAIHGGLTETDPGDDAHDAAAEPYSEGEARPRIRVRSLAAHFAAHLLSNEHGLRRAVAAQSSTHLGLLALDPSGEGSLTAILPGLAALMWSADPEV